MALLQTLRSFVNERLCAAADEIFVVVERIITEYEDEAFSSKQQQLQQRILDVVLKHPDVGFRVADVSPEQQERSPCLIQEEEPESSPVKEEQEELLLIPEEADGSTLTLAAVKHEDDYYDDNDDDNNSSETEALASTSTEHMKTHTDAEDRGSSQSMCGVQLLSSHWSESRMEDRNDGEETEGTKEAQSTLLDGKAWGHSISDSLHLPLCKEEVSPEWQERNPSLVVQEEQELLQIKDEQGGILQRPNEADGSLMAVKIDDGDANVETGPLSSTLTEHMKTQAGVEDLPAHCYEFHTENGDEWEETSNALKPQKSHNAQRVEGQTLSSSDKLSQNLEWSKLTLSARSHTGGNGHERTTNAGGTPFSCKVCQKHFSLNCHLKRHMESHTGLKPFSCTVCGKDFAQKNNLTRHIITHTYLPYSCIVCCKSYGLKSQLKTHMQTHSAKPVKPFICAFCGKCFGQSYALKRHTMIHTGEKPFSCPVCGKCFGLKHDLKRHMGIHRRETF